MKRIRFLKEISITYLTICIVTYLYIMVNELHNYDTLVSVPQGDGAGINVGRWLVYLLYWSKRKLTGGTWYNSSFLNVLIGLVFIYVGIVVLIQLFDIREKSAAIAITAIMAINPCIYVAMVFHFMAITFGIAFFTSILGVWFGKHGGVKGFLLGGILLAVGLGGYQAYFTFAAACMFVLIVQDLMGGEKWNKVLVLCAYYFGMLAYAFGVYYFILKVMISRTGQTLGSYQGADEMGRIPLQEIPELMKRTYVNYANLLTGNYLSLTPIKGLNICFALLTTCVIGSGLVYIFSKGHEIGSKVLLVVLLAIYPMVADSIEIVANKSHIYSLMGIALMSACILPITMAESNNRKVRNYRNNMEIIPLATIAIMCVLYLYINMANSLDMKYKLEVAKSWNQTLYTRISCVDGYTSDKEIIVYGSQFENTPHYDVDIGNLKYAGTNIDVNVYSKSCLMEIYIGQTYREMTKQEMDSYMFEIQSMSVYPDCDSIRIVNDKVIVKISN